MIDQARMDLPIGRSNVEHVLPRRTSVLSLVALALALVAFERPVGAQPAGAPAPPTTTAPLPPALVAGRLPAPWDSLGDDLVDAFTGTNLLFYGGAVGVTGAMAFGGADHAIRVAVQRNLVVPGFGDTAFYAGYLLPAVVAPAVYLVSLAIRDPELAAAGSAAIQALAIELLATSMLKVGVGRPYPLNGGDPRAPDCLDHPEYAREFRPFSSLWPLPAWPSGHTSAATAVAAALTASYPRRPWIALVSYSVALAIGLGLISGDRHWTSDVVAGALIGHAIGYSVGSAFHRRARAASGDPFGSVQLLPLVGQGLLGAAVGRVW